jgi:type IV pilus assembly protein PilM
MAKVTVGLKVGSTSLKFVEIIQRKGGFRLKKIGVEEFPLSEKSQEYLSHSSFLAGKIQEVITIHKLNPRRIVTGVEGKSVVVRIIRVPQMKDSELRRAIKWEAEEHIPYPMEDVSLGYYVLRRDLLGSRGREISILLVGVKRKSIDEHLSIFQQAGLCPAIIDVNSLALYNVVKNSNIEITEGTALLNIGHRISNLVIIAEDFPWLVRDINFGGDNITRDLAKAWGISYVEAEKVKKTRGISGIDLESEVSIEEKEISRVIRDSLEVLIKEIVHSFEYFTSNRKGALVQRVFLAGGGSLIKNMDKFLSQELEISVQRINPFSNIRYPEKKFQQFLPSRGPLFAIPAGLALREVSWI